MTGHAYLVSVALLLCLLDLAAFLWALRNGQFDDLDGAAHRILLDDDKVASKDARTDPLSLTGCGGSRTDRSLAWGCSSAGFRALACHARGRGFESRHSRHYPYYISGFASRPGHIVCS